MADKARCSECLGEFQVKKDGTMRWHGDGAHYPPRMCPGAGKPPAVMHRSPWADFARRYVAEKET